MIDQVLLVEDNLGDARLLREMFREQDSEPTELTHAETMSDAEHYLAKRRFDMILLDLGLPDTNALEGVGRALIAAPQTPLVVLTGLDDEALAVGALQAGAQDYLVKGQLDTRGLLRALRYAIERKVMKEALFDQKERAQVTLDCIGDAVICADAAGQISFMNVVAERMTGWLGTDAAGRPMGDVFAVRAPVAVVTSSATAPIVEITDHGLQLPPGCSLARRDGGELPIEGSMAPIHDRHGQATGTVLVFRDVSEARALTLQITHSAQHDSLTGLPNRAHLTERITTAISFARRHSARVALLFLDLDGFKHINDSLGHSFGDRLLQSVGDRIVGCARTTDTVSRQGGDEFVVLLAEVATPEHAAIVAQRILTSVAAPHMLDEHELHIEASIGVSLYPDDGLDAETLIKNADTAMYQAKAHGRQSVRYFTPEMNARAVERQWIEAGLRRALERGELALAYQPKISFKTGQITGAEALLRWTHPVRGPISPAQFIPIAEDTGLIRQIGAWVLRRACTQAKAWADAGLPLSTMAVNVSSLEFRDDSFLDGLFEILEDTGLPPSALELELTESVLMKHVDTAAATLGTLRDHGVQVAIDDFGTGYSSLSYLRKFPIDALKIDQSFVSGITTAADDASIVTAVIGMARSLKLRVVAEGVETREQATFLAVHECDEAQGYYYSRPVTPERFEHLADTLPETESN